MLEAEKFQGKVGQVTHVHTDGTLPSRRVVVVGLGRAPGRTAEMLRRAAAAAVLRRARDSAPVRSPSRCSAIGCPRASARRRVVEGAILGTYTFDRYKREKTDKDVETLRLVEPDGRVPARGRPRAPGAARSSPRRRGSPAT